jgi:DNA-binding Lrp family transcriptional regulator
MTPLELKLLDDFQRDFPLVPRPYAALAQALGVTEREVIGALEGLLVRGAISRVGAVFRPGAIGASTLAAMAVPPERLEAVASIVSSFREVNHNYEREHRYNLWFVAAATDEAWLAATLEAIARMTGIAPIALPLIEEYHIDLGFPLTPMPVVKGAGEGESFSPRKPRREALSARDRAVVAALEAGLPLVPHPYTAIARRVDIDVAEVIARIAAWQASGVIRRFGIVVRHHELGYRANAMAVWDVPDEAVARYGRALAQEASVTLAYARVRHAPDWPYNLYCMIHGADRGRVEAELRGLARRLGLTRFAHAVLFSRTRFKQAGARIASLATVSEYG